MIERIHIQTHDIPDFSLKGWIQQDLERRNLVQRQSVPSENVAGLHFGNAVTWFADTSGLVKSWSVDIE